MPVNYRNGQIYRLIDSDDNTFYIGSTTQKLSMRKSEHSKKARLDSQYPVHCHIRDCDYNYKIELIEYHPCDTKAELHKREGELQRAYKKSEYDLKNVVIAGRTQEQYRKEESEKIRESKKKYYDENNEKMKFKSREYRKEHGETINLKNRERYATDEEYAQKFKDNANKYRESNAEKIAIRKKLRVNCPICGIDVNKNNIARHHRTKMCQENAI